MYKILRQYFSFANEGRAGISFIRTKTLLSGISHMCKDTSLLRFICAYTLKFFGSNPSCMRGFSVSDPGTAQAPHVQVGELINRFMFLVPRNSTQDLESHRMRRLDQAVRVLLKLLDGVSPIRRRCGFHKPFHSRSCHLERAKIPMIHWDVIYVQHLVKGLSLVINSAQKIIRMMTGLSPPLNFCLQIFGHNLFHLSKKGKSNIRSEQHFPCASSALLVCPCQNNQLHSKTRKTLEQSLSSCISVNHF